jgi:hypothetical protein
VAHMFGESMMNLYRQGLAVGAAIRLTQDTFGQSNANSVVGYEPGTAADPSIQEIENRCNMTGCRESDRGEMLYLYRLGLNRGLQFNWDDTRERRPQGTRR